MNVQHRMESQRGQIGKEIKSGVDKNQQPWCNFSMAVDVDRLNEQQQWEKVRTDWYDVSVFGAQARNVAESLRPGAPIVVTGDVSIETRVVNTDEGPVAQMRSKVIADVVAPDLRRAAVILPERQPRAAQADARASVGPRAGAEAEWPGAAGRRSADALSCGCGRRGSPSGGPLSRRSGGPESRGRWGDNRRAPGARSREENEHERADDSEPE